MYDCKSFKNFNEACQFAQKHISSKQLFDAQLNFNTSTNKFYELQKEFTVYALSEEEKGISLITTTQQLLTSDFVCTYSYYQILKNIGELNIINRGFEEKIRNSYQTYENDANKTNNKTSDDTQKSSTQNENEENKNFYNHKQTTDIHSQPNTLFNGCTDRESITKRYRQLMKIYHTDNPNGDKEIAQLIQTTYQKIINQI